MAIVSNPTRVCDVTGTTRGVVPCQVNFGIVKAENELLEVLLTTTIDLSPRGQARLVRFIKRGLSPVGPTKKDE